MGKKNKTRKQKRKNNKKVKNMNNNYKTTTAHVVSLFVSCI